MEDANELRGLIARMLRTVGGVPKGMLEQLKRLETKQIDTAAVCEDDLNGAPLERNVLTWLGPDNSVVHANTPPAGEWQPGAHGFEQGVVLYNNPYGFSDKPEHRFYFSQWRTCNCPEPLNGRDLLFRIGVKPVPSAYKIWLRDDAQGGRFKEWWMPPQCLAPAYPHAATLLLNAPKDANIEPCFVRVEDEVGLATAYLSNGHYVVHFTSDSGENTIRRVPWYEVDAHERQELQSGFLCRFSGKTNAVHAAYLRLEGQFVNKVYLDAEGVVRAELRRTSLHASARVQLQVYEETALCEVPWALKDMTSVEDIFSLKPEQPYFYRSMLAYLFVQDSHLALKLVENLHALARDFDARVHEWRVVLQQELMFRVRVLACKSDDWWDTQASRCVDIFQNPDDEASARKYTSAKVRRAVRAARGMCVTTHAVRSHMEKFCGFTETQKAAQYDNLGSTMMLTHSKEDLREFWDNLLHLHSDVPFAVEAARALGYAETPENPFEHEEGFGAQVVVPTAAPAKSRRKGRRKKKKKKSRTPKK